MSRARPEPAASLTVALLEKRGRFFSAEAQFAPRAADGTRTASAPRRIALGASLAGPVGRKARSGDLVLVRTSARGGRAARAEIVRVIGRPDVARDAIEALMLDRGLAREFADAVERDARRACERGLEAAADLSSRRDLRELATFTIDPATARDFDDAISAERSADGASTRVWVHIADVDAYAPEGSLVDREARRRGTSVYVPGAVEPMLPRALSNDACSLVPGRDRLAVTVELELDGAAVRRKAFYRSLIRSDARLDYEQVDRIFAGGESAEEPWGRALDAARAVSAALGEARAKRGGALTLDQAEPEFAFDAQGNVEAIHARTQTESHKLIEHLMIAANEAVAGLLAERRVPCLYRVHERPELARVERLVDQLVTLAVPTPPVPTRMSREQAAELVAEISRRVEAHVRALAARARAGDSSVSRSGGRHALTSLVLRSLQQAYYSPKNLGHAGLGSACYCHFTSPIRRYPDLVCHRALLSAVGGGGHAPPRAGALAELGEWTSQREREAMAIERAGDDVARCFALERALYEQGWEQRFDGEVTGLIAAGAFIAFGREDGEGAAIPPYEGMLPVRRMSAGGEREWWQLNEQGTIMHGERSGQTLRLGEPVEVQVARVDAIRGRVDLKPAR